MEPLQFTDKSQIVQSALNSVQRTDSIVRKLRDIIEWAQTSMTVVQQNQKKLANRRREQTLQFKIGNKIWLDLNNVRTNYSSKKLN